MDLDAMTLRCWYQEHFQILFHTDARPRTIESYLTTIRGWEKATNNAPVSHISAIDLAKFRAQFANQATSAKHCRQLNAMLAKLGPPGPRNRDALGLITTCPWVKPPRARNRLPLIPDDSLIEIMIRQAPTDLALFTITAALTGSRQTAIRMLTLAAIDKPGQYIRFPAETDKRNCERLKPIPNILLRWWDRFGEQSSRWRIDRSSWNQRWKRWTKKLGAEPLRPACKTRAVSPWHVET